MRILCRMVIDTRYEKLPSNIVDQSKRSILDTLAVTVGGSGMGGIETIVDFVKDKGGKPDSFIPFYGGKVPASEAGLAIGPMSRAMDFGDNHKDAMHCSEYILPALIAASGLKDKVSGEEFITAFAVGSEVLVRIGIGFQASKSLASGRDGGHFIFGCVAAVGKLLGLSLNELEMAQGIVSEMTQPHSGLMYNPPTDMIRGHHGFICQDAINACLLAQRGMTGPVTGVLSTSGGYPGFIQWETNIDALTDELGQKWEMTNLMMKHYPCVATTQGAIDSLLGQMQEFDFDANDIASIDIDIDSTGASFITTTEGKETQWNPVTVHDCQFSIPYGLATAAYTGDLFLDSYSEAARSRSDVRELMARIKVVGDDTLPKRAGRLHTTTTAGETHSTEYLHPKGHPNNPLTNQDLIDKFKKCSKYCAYSLNATTIDSVTRAILELETIDDVVSALIAPLTPR